ncbi:MAG: cytochrome c family protein [Alphaproteobacteria bacterium]|nr:cytochrome c family protein [Alphaproteobacteria bacterium]
MDDRSNTIAGWVLFAGIVALGGAIITGEHFRAERPEKMGYPIEGVSDQPEGGAAVAEQPIAFYLATAKPELGAQVFKRCMACHTDSKGGPAAIGPNLYGVVGAPVGHMAGFPYTADLKALGGTWDWDKLNKWLSGPKALVPGTKMSFAGLSKPEDRANVIAYLNSTSDKPLPMPAPPAASPAKAAAEAADSGAQGDKGKDQPVLNETQAVKGPGKSIAGDAAPSVSGNAAQTKK